MQIKNILSSKGGIFMQKKVKKLVSIALTSVMTLGVMQTAFAGTYVVQKGDYLTKIAPKFNTTWRVLAEMNDLANPNLIFPNQVLQVPDVPEEPATVQPETTVPAETTTPAPAETTVPTETVVEEKAPVLTALQATTMDNKQLTPAFSPDVTEYSITVQSDIYGVLLTPTCEDGAKITVTASITPAAYGGTDVNEPMVIEKSDMGYVVPLTETYEGYDSEFVQTATVDVTKGDLKTTYTVTITRECDTDIYNLFTQDKFTGTDGTEIEYNLYVPTDYDPAKEYPVVLVLHGGGQRTQPTDMILKRYQMATIWAKDSEAGKNQCIVIAPHMVDSWYEMEEVNGSSYPISKLSPEGNAAYELLQSVKEKYSVNDDKIYVTGASMGGMGSLTFGYVHTDEFAAIMPCCAREFINEDVDYTKYLPLSGKILYAHAEDDPTCPYSGGQIIMDSLTAAGVDFETRIYPSGTFFYPSAHFSWVPLYGDETVRDWLFAQTK